MREDTVVTKVYTFDELSDEAKEKAREWWREFALYDKWWDDVYGIADEVFKALGITSDKMTKRMDGSMRRSGPCIWFSGFSSQGDGACFEGTYSYAKGAAKKLKELFPHDEELQRIAKELQDLQSRHFYKLSAAVKHSGHYYHKHCTDIEVYIDGDDYNVAADLHEGISDLLRDVMDWIYEKLEAEHDYLLSDECVDENIHINEYEFTEDGNLY